MKKIILWVAIWIACGIFNWGVVLGDFCGSFPSQPSRSHYGFAAMWAVAGPFGTAVTFFGSNLYEHGLRWK